jgi:hypothetical protein
VRQLREAIESIQRRHCAVFSHDFESEMLVLEVDLTGLKASKKAELSTKGYFSGSRNTTGRQLLRVSAPRYGEVIFEKLYPGNTNSCEVLKRTMMEVERFLEVGRKERGRTLIRLDGGFGTDSNLNWLIWRGYEFVAKRATGEGEHPSWPRACLKGAGMKAPLKVNGSGCPPVPISLRSQDEDRREALVRREGQLPQGLPRVSTLFELSAERIAKLYDGRGGMEVDIKGDKSGGLGSRRGGRRASGRRKRWCSWASSLTICSYGSRDGFSKGRRRPS